MRLKQLIGTLAAAAACISFTACGTPPEEAKPGGSNEDAQSELPLALTSVTADNRNEACQTILGSPDEAFQNMGMNPDELLPENSEWDAEFLPRGDDVTLRCWTADTVPDFDGRFGIWMATGDMLAQVDNDKQGTVDESRQVGAIVNFIGENDVEKFITENEMQQYIDEYVIDNIER